MNLTISEKLQTILDMINEFVEKELIPLESYFNKVEFRDALPALWEKQHMVKQMELRAPNHPVECGMGLNLIEHAYVSEALGRTPLVIVGQQHDIGLLAGQIGAAAHGDGNLGLGQHRRVIDAVADHRDDRTALLQFHDDGVLGLRRQAAAGVGHAQPGGDFGHGGRGVAAQDADPPAGAAQGIEQGPRLRAQAVVEAEQRQPAGGIGQTDDAAARLAPAQGGLGQRPAVQGAGIVGVPMRSSSPPSLASMPDPVVTRRVSGMAVATGPAAARRLRPIGCSDPTSSAAAMSSTASADSAASGSVSASVSRPRVSVPVLSKTK